MSEQAVAAYPEAAAVVSVDGTVLVASEAFQAIVGLSAEARLAHETAGAVRALWPEGGGRRRISLESQDGKRVLDLLLFPQADGSRGLLIVNDYTLDSGMRNALVESRARYKDLVEVSTDCAWEVDESGDFSFVSRSLVGHGAREVVGRPAADLLDGQRNVGPVSPFAAPAPLSRIETWMRRADGGLACLEVSALPLLDPAGAWKGARGICRDVTEERNRAVEVAEARARDRVLARILRLFRREADPESMVKAAAAALTHGLASSGCQIYSAIAPEGGGVTLTLEGGFGRTADQAEAERLLAALQAPGLDGVLHAPDEAFPALGFLTYYGDRMNGALLVWREPGRPPFSASDNRLMASIGGQIGVALEQLRNHRVLVDVSRTDGLTGLMNRRGFYEAMQRRIRRLAHGSAHAALMYVDLDNFKQVNDTHGHKVGDEALCRVAEILRANTRSTDMVARLGGDEFAVWLDDADTKVATKRAQVFLAAATVLRRYSGSEDKPLMLSIGVSVFDAAYGEDINEFISRADAAMYTAKRRGKGTFEIAPPPAAGKRQG